MMVTYFTIILGMASLSVTDVNKNNVIIALIITQIHVFHVILLIL